MSPQCWTERSAEVLPAVPVLPPLQGEDLKGVDGSGNCADHAHEPSTGVGTSLSRESGVVSDFEGYEVHSSLTRAYVHDKCDLDGAMQPARHSSTSGESLTGPVSEEDGHGPVSKAPCASAADEQHPLALDRWQSMMQDVAALSAQVDRLLNSQQRLLGEAGEGSKSRAATCVEEAEPGLPEYSGLNTVNPRLGNSRPSRSYDPLRYCAPESPQLSVLDSPRRNLDVTQDTCHVATPALDFMEMQSLLVQARLRERSQHVYERRCHHERWRSSGVVEPDAECGAGLRVGSTACSG